MRVFVDRDDQGKVTAVYRNAQREGHEVIDSDAPDVEAYRNRPRASASADAVATQIENSPVLRALIRRMAKAEGITPQALLNQIRAEVGP